MLAIASAAVLFSSLATFTMMQISISKLSATSDHMNTPTNSATLQSDHSNPSQTPANASVPETDLTKIAKAYNLIENDYVKKTSDDTLVNGAIHGMIQALHDPFSDYLDPQQTKSLNKEVSSSFDGIGAEVLMKDGQLTVKRPMQGSPASQAGLAAGDVIVTVNGQSISGLSLDDAIKKIRGPKGSQVRLGIMRSGFNDPKQFIVVRNRIQQETVKSEMLSNGIGKIEITQFSYDTAQHFKEQLAALEAQHLKGLILDVRNNPGGSLKSVVSIVEPFVQKGRTIVQLEDSSGHIKPTVSETGRGKPYPIVVLINENSASAAEILAGAFEQSVGSRLIGMKSYGKGTVQETVDLGDGSNIKMTMYKWLLPNGAWINKKGIMPNQVVRQPSYFEVVPLSKKSTLKYDMVSNDVKNLQMMLDGLGYSVDRTDGYYSHQTVTAVKHFQEKHKLPVTGEVDSKTAEQIESDIIDKIENPKNDLQLQAAIQYLNKAILAASVTTASTDTGK